MEVGHKKTKDNTERTAMQANIYIADDEENIRDLLASFLREAGHRVEVYENGDRLLKAVAEKEPDLVILDVMMPGTDGFSTCSAIRKKTDIPIILLTARGTDADYITGFTMGCDDYFTKPFSPVKLTMRVNAILKRLYADKAKTDDRQLAFGDLALVPAQKEARCGQRLLKLTATEYDLLQYILENKDRAVSREELLNSIWGYDKEVETRVTDDTIKRLRKKIRDSHSQVAIETIWGFGFKLSHKE